ncbi:hypothetical protein [Colwellia sp. RSH04]|uniref:hypothetical protein n=1 Tax=Colwellia sp. RSH04 TaxID=2305464 RepID=UPI000E5702B4|nr:hypothetical protein [Colwellia sp. RSH04]RHW75004.1 hypothetical protein D1094_15350 [Colwellia sp. RSH04]
MHILSFPFFRYWREHVALLLSACICFAVSTNVKASFDETAPHHALEALRVATLALNNRENTSLALAVPYDKKLSDTEGNQTTLRFDPSKPNGMQWATLSIVGKSLAEVKLPNPFMLTPAVVDKLNLTYFEEEPDYWVFKGDMDIYSTNEPEKNTDKQAEVNFDKYLVAFVGIDKQTRQFKRLSFTNLDSFRPSTLAIIDRIVIDALYAPLSENGPLVAVQSQLTISGSYGFLYSFEEVIKQEIEKVGD